MELITAAEHGWTKLRWRVFQRDMGCIAVQHLWFGQDIARDQCKNKAGWLIRWNDVFQMEFDHVKSELGTSIKAPDDEAHGVTVCPWHHRGDGWRIDTKEHRAKIRERLAKLYPAVWASVG